MKIDIVGASNFVNRMFEACGKQQWAREFLKNSLEAGATKIEFGIEWQDVERSGIYRRIVADNGCGMSRDELLKFFRTLGEGGKKIGGVHENFGVGARISSLPWNPEGVVVISYKDGKASMIWIVLDEDSGEYELINYESDAGNFCVIDPSEIVWPDVDWNLVKPAWIEDHGTVIVLLGSKEYRDTVLGNPAEGEDDIKGLSTYLNTRFWDLSGDKEVKVVELRSNKKNQWPLGVNDKDDARRPNNRTIRGAKYYLTDVRPPKDSDSKLKAHDVIMLDGERVLCEWYLWEGPRPQIHMYARETGYIALRYGDELFEITSGKVPFRNFGVVESKVQQNLTLILEPQHYSSAVGNWGVHPDQSRNRLIFTGNGEKGVAPPLIEWGLEFADNMPDAIHDAIRKARGDLTASIEDEEYRKRLQEKFGDRWTMKVKVQAKKKNTADNNVAITDKEINVIDVPDLSDEPRGVKRRFPRTRKTMKVMRKVAVLGSDTDVTMEVDVPVDVPKIRFEGKDDFEKPWHLALWAPNAVDGPTVIINKDSPILQEIVEYHQDQYPPIHAEEVAKTVRAVFGEVAACKIAHSQKLTKEISEEDLDKDYRSEAALTIALMGLMAEESLIAQRLGKFGRKKSAA